MAELFPNSSRTYPSIWPSEIMLNLLHIYIPAMAAYGLLLHINSLHLRMIYDTNVKWFQHDLTTIRLIFKRCSTLKRKRPLERQDIEHSILIISLNCKRCIILLFDTFNNGCYEHVVLIFMAFIYIFQNINNYLGGS